jgi:hypothetical protein
MIKDISIMYQNAYTFSASEEVGQLLMCTVIGSVSGRRNVRNAEPSDLHGDPIRERRGSHVQGNQPRHARKGREAHERYAYPRGSV